MPIRSFAAQQGNLAGAVIQPCAKYGIIVVILQYGPGADPHDVDVELDVDYVSKHPNGDTFTFRIAADRIYGVVLNAPTWSHRFDYEYQGDGMPDHHTVIDIPLHVHTIQISAQDTDHFIPNDEFVQLTYDITGQPETVATVDLIVFVQGPPGGGLIEIERHPIPGPYAAQATYNWSGALARMLAESPFSLQLELTSDVGRQCVSNLVDVEIRIDHIEIEIDTATITAMGAGNEKTALQLLDHEVQATGEGQMIYHSPIFKTSSVEMTTGASFIHYSAMWGAGINIPLLANIYFSDKTNNAVQVPRLLNANRVLWDVRYDTEVEFAADLGQRGLHAQAQAFVTAATDYERLNTRPQGRTAHLDLYGMRADVAGRRADQRHWSELDAAWVYQLPGTRGWSAYTDCGARAASTAASGVFFRSGRHAADVHRVKAYIETNVPLDTLVDATLTGLPAGHQSNEIRIQNWRSIPVVEDYWIGVNRNLFDLGPLSAEYEKAGLVVQRNLIDFGDKTNDWQTEYTRLQGFYAAIRPWVNHAMLPNCGDHPAAFRTYNAYLRQAMPRVRDWPRRAVAMLSTAQENTYKAECERYAYIFIQRIIAHLFPAPATVPGAYFPPVVPLPRAEDGLAIIQFEGAGGVYNLEETHGNGTRTRGVALSVGNYSDRNNTCFLTFGPNIPIETVIHEIGHHLFLAHAPGHYTPGQQPGGYQPNDHDQNDVCIMSYATVRNGLCGLCLLKLAGYDYSRINSDGTIT